MRRTIVRSAALVAAAGCALAPLTVSASTDTSTPTAGEAEGSAASTPAASDAEGTVAFLMPDIASTRYELFDAPLFTARMGELCPNCKVIYLNADADPATQQQQANSVLSQGADVIVLDPVDSTAAATIVSTAQSQGVAIVAYDRPIPDAAADFYVSFDNFAIGAAITQSLVDHLDEIDAEGGVLQVNGSPTDAAAGLIGDGIHSVLDDSGYEILAEFDTPGWQPPEAQNWVSGQITRFPDQIAGVVAANDGTGGAAIAAFKAAGVDVPPVTGNDAELAAVQRIISGDQFNTISKPIHIVAEAAADVAFAFLQGEAPESDTELFDTPSQLFQPTVITRDNVAEFVMGPEGPYPIEDICTDEYADACQELGIA
jgi:simple sugar transport system substrate-binding protein/D-xylose transport system substrate-binding protein